MPRKRKNGGHRKWPPRREPKASQRRRLEFMTVFINGKQKRVRRPVLIDGMDEDTFIRQNADPIWLAQHGMYEYLEDEKHDP
ncbi:MAG: hypothetical protein HQL64_12320 [Magnetococcales bacterium]|nr:hypothetical protein [Magnetococcales bacterium]